MTSFFHRHSDKEMIWPMEGGEPLQGTFAIKLGRNCPERAILIRKQPCGLWSVKLDGEEINKTSQFWHEAFGWLWNSNSDIAPILLGRRVDPKTYAKIIQLRLQDIENGIDITQPTDYNAVTPPF